MDLKRCCNTHFIQAIKGQEVTKVRNRDSRGRPALVSKTLQDVYKSEDAKRIGRSPKTGSPSVKCEAPCFPTVNRMLREPVECFRHDGDGTKIDLDDDTTLKQLRDRFRTKKRKSTHGRKNSNQAYLDEKPLEDQSDLDGPLINWKSRKPKKLKANRKRVKRSIASSLITSCAIKSEKSTVSEIDELAPVVSVKIEVQEAGECGEHIKTSLADDSSLDHNEEPSFGDASNDSQMMDQHDYTEQQIVCVTNENSYSPSEDVEPMSMLLPWHGMDVKLETPEFDCHEYQNLHPLAIEYGKETFDDQDRDFSSHMSEQNNSSHEQVPDISIGLLHEQDNSLSRHDLKIDENLVYFEDTTADKEQPSFCTLDGIKSNGLSNGSRHMEDELLKSGVKQTSSPPIIGVETQSCIINQSVDSADTLASPEPHPHPEKLLSKRKVISPSSRERLRLEMNSEERSNNVDQYFVLKCKGKLFEKQTGKKASFCRSDVSSAKVTINHGARGNFNHSIKKSQYAKGSFEGARPRTLPKISTACTSIEGCSENAIAFSQRQIHDMESIAVKLMNELNSMKEVVEQKLLFTAYRNAPLKNNTDEVKSAICKATKVGEVARKWLSVMSRDCNRFCKIMKMTPSGVESKDTVRNGKKKITFADEVGGELFQVKFFKVGESSSPMSDEVKQGLHSA